MSKYNLCDTRHLKLLVGNIQHKLENDLAYQYSIENNDAKNMALVLREWDLPCSMADAMNQIKHHNNDMYLDYVVNLSSLKSKVDTAREFVASHKEFGLGLDIDRDALLAIYHNLIGGLYGETRSNGMGEFEIEIPAFESRTGRPILFNFEYIGDKS